MSAALSSPGFHYEGYQCFAELEIPSSQYPCRCFGTFTRGLQTKENTRCGLFK